MFEFIFKVINFAVLFFLLYKFMKKPLVNAVKERHSLLKRSLEEAREAKEQWEAKYREYDERLKRVEEEAQRIRQEIIAEAERERARIIKEAEEAAERIKRQAQMAVEQEVKAIERRLRKEMADLTVQLAEKLIRDSIGPEDQHRLIDDYVQGIRRFH